MAKRRSPKSDEALAQLRRLNHLVSVGDATLKDFDLLGISSVAQLAKCDPEQLYQKLCEIKGVTLDPCCEDVFRAAVEQARDPKLTKEKSQWWYWSRERKKGSQREAGRE